MSTQLPSLPSDTRLVTGQAHGENKTGIVQFTMCKKLEDLEFADDLVLLSERIAHGWQKLESLQDEASKVGLKVKGVQNQRDEDWFP